MKVFVTTLACSIPFLLAGLALADSSDWAEGSSQYNDGANREYYNRAAVLPWKHFMGDWRDANDLAQGDTAYAIAEIVDDDTHKAVEWNVTSLVREWMEGHHPNQGMLLRVVHQRGTIVFGSRENNDPRLHPELKISGDQGTVVLPATADTYLTKSTYRSQGDSEELRVSSSPDHLLIRFDEMKAQQVGRVTKAILVLHSNKQFGSATVGVFRCRQGHDQSPSERRKALAASYPGDQGIGEDPQVVLATSFESPSWQEEWSVVGLEDKVDTVSPETDFKGFQPWQGKALRCRIAEGSMTGLNLAFKFRQETGEEPEAIYFRYYLRLADDWNQTVQGGKLPGISGTYGRGGWGGRKSDGINGWSARGLFKMTIPDGNPLSGKTPIGFYCYHADMEGSYGTNWIWSDGYRGYLEKNRWYAIEQYCQLNTPGKKDGILRAWVDGHLAFEKTDIRFRLTDQLKIEQVWMNVYHGGTIPSPYDQHVFIDNVVIAKQYIGPMRSTSR